MRTDTKTDTQTHTHTHLSRWRCFSPSWRQPEELISDKKKGITDQRSRISVDSILVFRYFLFFIQWIFTHTFDLFEIICVVQKEAQSSENLLVKVCVFSYSKGFSSTADPPRCFSDFLFTWLINSKRSQNILKLLKQLWKQKRRQRKTLRESYWWINTRRGI